MKTYSPGASVYDDFAYGCDNCEKWGMSLIIWKDLPDGRDHFALCYKCLGDLYLEFASGVDKQKETLTIDRMRISEESRNEIYERDNWQCLQCGSNESLTLDHIIPFSRGGKTEKSNLQTLCQSCNSKKGTRVG